MLDVAASAAQMSSQPNVKAWHPARFTLSQDNSPIEGNPFAVLILNQPLENTALTFQSCERGAQCGDYS